MTPDPYRLSISLSSAVSRICRASSISAGVLLAASVLLASSGIPVPTGVWTLALTHGVPSQANGWEQLVYAPALKQSIMLAMYHQRHSEPNESLVGYSFDTNSWGVLDMGGNFHTESMPEGGESQGYFGFNPNNNTLVFHCCTTGSNQTENINHTWWYDVIGQSGRDKHTSPKPGSSILQPGGTFDSAHNVFVFHGGDSFAGTWTYDPASNRWRKMNPSGTPPDPSILLAGVAYNSNNQKVYLFGGQTGSTLTNDLYSYNYTTDTWTLITPTGVKPPVRYRHAFAYDSTNNIFLLYGGQDASGILNDTWVYDPSTNAWQRLTPSQSPPIAGTAIFAKMSYDSDHNVFVLAQAGVGGYFGGPWNTLALQTWLFRYRGTGPNAGTVSSAATPASGGLNRNVASWAKDPALASSGSALYAVWSEVGSPFEQTDAAWAHIYATQYLGGAWAPLGSSYQSISSTAIREAHAPSLAVVAGAPWASWYEADNTGAPVRVFAKQWAGGSWQGGQVGVGGAGVNTSQGQSQIVAVGGAPHVAVLEVDKDNFPQRTLVFVKAWNGSAWTAKGGPLNRSLVDGNTALSVSMASDGTNPYVTWPEYKHTAGNGIDFDTNPQIYASRWSGSQWVTLGGSLNVNPSDSAYDPAIAFWGGQPYVAWTERTQAGNAQLYVKTWNGANWVLVGSGALNRAPGTGWAYHPSLAADQLTGKLYLSWVEQTALGQKAQVFVSQYAAGSWTGLGSSLNADPVKGSAQRVSLAVFNGQPVAGWGEVNAGALRQIHVKQWNGSAWIPLSGSAAPDTDVPAVPTGVSAAVLPGNAVQLSWAASSDLVGVTGYFIYRNGSQIADETSFLKYVDTGLLSNTTYSYRVAAHDGSGHVSAQSGQASVTMTDTTQPTVQMTAPSAGATVSGSITVSANATDNVGVSSVQFKLDGANLGSPVTGAGPAYSISWNSASAGNGSHTLSAVASDAAGNSASASVTITVSNGTAPPVISGVSATSITSTGATINWTTDKPADSRVAYGLSSSYGSTTPLNSTLLTSHSVNLSGLSPSTTYHYQALSRDMQGNLTASANFTFQTAAPPTGPQPVFQLHADVSELAGVTNGSAVTPAVTAAGLNGTLVVNGAGSVNFTPGQSGDGLYFLNCCNNGNNAYYRFAGAGVGNVFDVNQGSITFYLKSRYSFAQRKASAAAARYAFDVRDATRHLFSFATMVASNYLEFDYVVGGVTQYYFAPSGTEDALFGAGVTLKVTLTWDSTTAKLYLNDILRKTTPYTRPTVSWTAASIFSVGAYQYLNYGAYNSEDDILDEFTILGTPPADTAQPNVQMTAPSAGATVSGSIAVSANATDNVGVSSVQFKLDGANLGSPVTGAGPAYSISWNSASAGNGSHTLSAVASDAAGNSASASVTITVSNGTAPPVISGVSATSITSTGATINWTTDKPADSQVAYGLSSSYGSTTPLNSTLLTSHSVNLSGLSPSTTYHYQALSRDMQGNLTASADFTFQTAAPPAGPQPVFQLHADASELAGVTNGSAVTPAVTAAGLNGTLVVNGAGSVNFTPGQSGDGLYFLNCCNNGNNAYYRFAGAGVGNVFDVNQGSITFYLKSRYSFAQRKASAAAARYAFDVRDATRHLFSFATMVTSNYLEFDYVVGGVTQYYFAPSGTEDALFGAGVTLKVTLTWDSTTAKLYLNDVLRKSTPYTRPTVSWTAASIFSVGAYQYLNYGAYNSEDDILDELTVFPQ